MSSLSIMEWNLNTSSEWDWVNLAMYSGKATEIPKRTQLPSNETEGNAVVNTTSIFSSGSSSFSGSALGHGSLYTSSISASVDSSSRVRAKPFGDIDSFPKDSHEKEKFSWIAKNGSFPNTVETSVVSGEPMIGLKLDRQAYCEDVCPSSTTITTSFSVMPTSSSSTMKRSRASCQSTQSPRCQVEGCNLDLTSAKDYHRRHRICESHSKSPKVIVAGMERRFCQQCSRFHGLSEFDDKKRSCRRRLSDHNARRRRPQTEDIQFGSTQSPSSMYDRRSQMNFLVNRFPIPVSNQPWDSACNLKVTLAGESLFSHAKGGGSDRKPHLSGGEVPNAILTLDLDSDRNPSFPGDLHHGLQPSTVTSNSLVAPEVRHAFSLLSSSSWGLNEPDPTTSLDQFVHENNISLAQPGMPLELQNWELSSSEYVRVEQVPSQPRVHKLDLQNTGSTQFQEFHSFKAPQESPSFYSNQIN